jgi:hypothetical protein
MTNKPTTTGICVIKTKGGMGNRMLCAASGILWARAVARTPYVDWRDEAYSRDHENSFPHFFANPDVLADPPDDTDDICPAAWRGQLGQSVSQMIHAHDPDKHSSLSIHKKYSVDPARADYPQATAVFWYYMGRFEAIAPLARKRVPGYAGLSVEAISRKALREELPLTPAVADPIETFAAEHLSGPTLGVHIRYSDRTTDLRKLEAAVRAQLAGLPDASIFLATDNKRVEDDYRAKFNRVITTPKWFPPEGATMHQNTDCNDPVSNGIEALTDMYLLARCDALVYASRSTFSEISRLVSDIPPDRVTDVDRRDPTMITKRLLRRLTA